MRTRHEYDQAFELIRAAIARWDPYDLLRGGAPAREFDSEVALLLPRIQHLRSVPKMAEAIAAVFSDRFEKQHFDPSSCAAVAEDIYASLSAAGLVSK